PCVSISLSLSHHTGQHSQGDLRPEAHAPIVGEVEHLHPTALHSHHCLHALNLEGEVRLIENVARGDQQVRRHQKGGGPSLGWLSASSTVPVSWWSGWESMVVVPSGSRRYRWPMGVVHSKAPGVV